jgi:hypothetical protein
LFKKVLVFSIIGLFFVSSIVSCVSNDSKSSFKEFKENMMNFDKSDLSFTVRDESKWIDTFHSDNHIIGKDGFAVYKKDTNPYPNNISGYIIQFQEKSLFKYESELRLKVSQSGRFDESEFSSMLENHKNRIIEEQTDAFKNIKQTINCVGNIEGILLTKFTNIFNGIVLDISPLEAEKIKLLPCVKKIYPNREIEICLNASVPLINADDVWSLQDPLGQNITGKDVTIAIVDTGIDYNHPDLGGGFGNKFKVVSGYDFVNDDNDPMDDNGHGTHCAGIAAGTGTASNKKYVGVAPDAKLHAYKVLGKDGWGWESWVIAGVERAVDPNNDSDTSDHVDVISISLGGEGDPDDPLCQVIDTVVELGVVVTVSAGNSGPSEESIRSPACARNAITVGSSTHLPNSQSSGGPDKIARYSSRGPTSIGTIKPDILAPGGDVNYSSYEFYYEYGITSCRANDTSRGNPINEFYTKASGTSMACPHVAGAAALIKQAHADWTSKEIKMALRNTAVDLGYDMNTQGYGRIDVLESVLLEDAPPIANLKTSGKIYGFEVDIIGTASAMNLIRYTLYYKPGWDLYFSDDSDDDSWIKLVESKDEKKNDTLGVWDISRLADGNYTLKLVVESQDQETQDRVLINIKNTEILYPKDVRDGFHSFPFYEEWEIFPSWRDIEINGTCTGFDFDCYTLKWKKQGNSDWSDEGVVLLNDGGLPVEESLLGTWNVAFLDESAFYFINLTSYYVDGRRNSDVVKIWIDTDIQYGWPKKIEWDSISPWAPPVIADINNDGKNDLIFAGMYHVTVYRHDGSFIDGWPKEIQTWYNDEIRASMIFPPAVGDLDNDGFNEIVTVDIAGYLHVFNHDGSYLDGFPKKFDSFFPQTPTLADIDNDGHLDIVFGDWGNNNYWTGYLHVVNLNGDYLEGWPKRLSTIFNPYAINGVSAIADLDKDGYNEIAVTTHVNYFSVLDNYELDGGTNVWLFNHDGTLLKGWPKKFDSGWPIWESGIVLADINDDSNMEVIFGLNIDPWGDTEENSKIYVWNLDGSLVDGWPQSIYNPWNSNSSIGFSYKPPAVSDINNDGYLEIIISNELCGSLWAFAYDGSLLDGWPVFDDYINHPILSDPEGTPLIGNLDNDDELEISVGTHGHRVHYGDLPNLYAYNSDGSIAEKFPKKIDDFMYIDSLPIGDLDNDGDNELIAATFKNIIIWDLPGSTEDHGWSQFCHDPQHTGTYPYDGPYVRILHPLEGYINIGNYPLIKTFLKNTYLFGKTTIKIGTGKDTSIVEFYIDNELKETLKPPFEWTWDESTSGKHVIKAIAYDHHGKNASDEVTIWKF